MLLQQKDRQRGKPRLPASPEILSELLLSLLPKLRLSVQQSQAPPPKGVKQASKPHPEGDGRREWDVDLPFSLQDEPTLFRPFPFFCVLLLLLLLFRLPFQGCDVAEEAERMYPLSMTTPRDR